jgi:hypothetical protein
MGNLSSYTSAILILCLSACAGAGNPGLPGAQRATIQRAAKAPYLYSACCGTGSGTYKWTKGSEHCAGSVDSTARTSLELTKDGKVITGSGHTGMVVTALLDSICKAWGASGILFYFDVTKGIVSVHKGVAVDATVMNGFCLPGSASGDATLIGSVQNAHLFVSKIAEHCKDFDYSISFGKVLIRDIPGQLYYH